jgi:hypothetical protein
MKIMHVWKCWRWGGGRPIPLHATSLVQHHASWLASVSDWAVGSIGPVALWLGCLSWRHFWVGWYLRAEILKLQMLNLRLGLWIKNEMHQISCGEIARGDERGTRWSYIYICTDTDDSTASSSREWRLLGDQCFPTGVFEVLDLGRGCGVSGHVEPAQNTTTWIWSVTHIAFWTYRSAMWSARITKAGGRACDVYIGEREERLLVRPQFVKERFGC